ncbi:MAG: diacylglycerol kinase family protein [Microbacterium sp.]
MTIEKRGVIWNPSKIDEAQLRSAVSSTLSCEVLWWATSEDDPGLGMAAEAVEAGCEIVVAVGGDGTVRAVAEALARTGVALGIVPKGTEISSRAILACLSMTPRQHSSASMTPSHGTASSGGSHTSKPWGGIRLLPDAEIDDGQLDLLLISADGSLQWLDTVKSVVWDNGIRRLLGGRDGSRQHRTHAACRRAANHGVACVASAMRSRWRGDG